LEGFLFVDLFIGFGLFLFDYNIARLRNRFLENSREQLLGKFIRGLAQVLLNRRRPSAIPILIIRIDRRLSESQNLRIELIHELLKVHG
jgi:hypothetical protein